MSSINFSLSGGGDIRSLNVSKKIDDSGEVLYLTLSLSGETNGGVIADLIGCETADTKCFWRTNDDLDPKFFGISSVVSGSEFTGHTLKLKQRVFKDVKLWAFSFKPVAGGGVSVSFKATLFDVSSADLESMAKLLKNTVACSVEGHHTIFDPKYDKDPKHRNARDAKKAAAGDADQQTDIDDKDHKPPQIVTGKKKGSGKPAAKKSAKKKAATKKAASKKKSATKLSVVKTD